MSSSGNVSPVTQLINVLSGYLKANSKLVDFDFHVIEYCNSPAVMFKKYLQNILYDVLVTVRHHSSITGREYLLVPFDKRVSFEVSIWMHDSPMYREESMTPMHYLVASEIELFFRQQPRWGTVKNIRNQSYANGQAWELCTTFTVTQLIES
jgi:hypothetical protein